MTTCTGVMAGGKWSKNIYIKVQYFTAKTDEYSPQIGRLAITARGVLREAMRYVTSSLSLCSDLIFFFLFSHRPFRLHFFFPFCWYNKSTAAAVFLAFPKFRARLSNCATKIVEFVLLSRTHLCRGSIGLLSVDKVFKVQKENQSLYSAPNVKTNDPSSIGKLRE